MATQQEREHERQIQEAGKTAPRITPDDIDAQIVHASYHRFEHTTVTVCLLTLRNGFHVAGYSAAVSPDNFDAAIGRKIAYDDARDRIWELEGYRLAQELFQGEQLVARDREQVSSPGTGHHLPSRSHNE